MYNRSVVRAPRRPGWAVALAMLALAALACSGLPQLAATATPEPTVTRRPTSTPAPTATRTPTPPLAPTWAPPVEAYGFTLRPANMRGSAEAPVLIIEFADFQCPFCRRHFATNHAPIVATFVEPGHVRLAYKHLAFLGQESVDAAVASECAADQGKFWEYHDYLFAYPLTGENTGAFSKDELVSFAAKLGLDVERFEPCLRNDETLPRVLADGEEASQWGVTGVPTFLINGTLLAGAQPWETFQAAIDEALK